MFRVPAIPAAFAAALLSLAAFPATAAGMTHDEFASVMNSVFGRGAWRMTGGYRTPEREDELRAQGAMTVRPGGVSRHSLGRPGAPGAYDLVVDGMSPFEAAERLRRSRAPFARYQPKGAHGTQGPHLHLEPHGFGPTPAGAPRMQMASRPKEKPEPGRARSETIIMPASAPRSAAALRDELGRLHAAAAQQRPEAQLELGRAYLIGYLAPRDFGEAYGWLASAADNPQATPEIRDEAVATLAQLPDLMEADRAEHPARYAGLKTSASDR